MIFVGCSKGEGFVKEAPHSAHKHLWTLMLTRICVLLCITVLGTGFRNFGMLTEDILNTEETTHDPNSTVYLLLAHLVYTV